jgi:hypothetical protein
MPPRKPDDRSKVDVRRERQRQEAEAVGADRGQQDRLAADAVGKPAPERLAEERAGRIGREQEPDLPAGRMEGAGVEGQQRHDDAEAQHVDHHHHEERGERRARAAQRRLLGLEVGHAGARKLRLLVQQGPRSAPEPNQR